MASQRADKTAQCKSPIDEFSELFRIHGRSIFAHIRSLVPDAHDADEVFQETGLVLWTKFANYQRDTDFRAWACRIAYYKVLQLRHRSHRSPRLFSGEFLASIDEELIVMSDALDVRSEALQGCCDRLGPVERQLIDSFYRREATVAEISSQLGRSIHQVYRSLRRIHDALFDCVKARLAME